MHRKRIQALAQCFVKTVANTSAKRTAEMSTERDGHVQLTSRPLDKEVLSFFCAADWLHPHVVAHLYLSAIRPFLSPTQKSPLCPPFSLHSIHSLTLSYSPQSLPLFVIPLTFLLCLSRFAAFIRFSLSDETDLCIPLASDSLLCSLGHKQTSCLLQLSESPSSRDRPRHNQSQSRA